MKVIIGVETSPRCQFTMEADPNDMPDIIQLDDGTLLRYVGRYTSPGARFGYRHVNRVKNFDGEVKDWIEFSHLTG